MALTATTVFEVEADAGSSDTLNGGGFDTASTGKLTDLTTDANTGNTASPIVSSASYNFVAADVGSWVHIPAGTNSIPGWYKVSAVGSNKATLNASIGAAVLANFTANTAVGIATVGTPTNLTFAVDYSQVPAAVFSLTGLTTAAANAIILTASATKAMVGNLIQIKSGTNFTVGFYVIQACTAGVSLTVDRNCTTAAGLAGTAGLGGSLASPGQAGAIAVAGNDLFIKLGTYTITSATANIAGGCISWPGTSTPLNKIIGYQSLRGDVPSGTSRPTIISDSVITTFTLVNMVGTSRFENLIVDGNSRTSSRGISMSSSAATNCKFQNCTNNAVSASSVSAQLFSCEITGCSTNPGISSSFGLFNSYVHDNTVTGISSTTACVIFNTISANNTGASSDGFSACGMISNCTSYGNGRDGFRAPNNSSPTNFQNCLSVNNGLTNSAGWGFSDGSSTTLHTFLRNCAGFNNFNGNVNTTQIKYPASNFVTLTADPFVNGAGANWALNNTAGGGASCRAAAIPGAFPGLATTIGYPDIGAVQSQAVVGEEASVMMISGGGDWNVPVFTG